MSDRDIIDELFLNGNEIVRAIGYQLPKFIRVLCIDDSTEDYLLLKRLLATYGVVTYDIECCDNSTEALQKILEKKHDIYLIDYKLIPTDGLELIKQATLLGGHGPFIIWSAYDGDSFYERILAENITGFIPKSILNENNKASAYKVVDNLIRLSIKNFRMIDSAQKMLKTLEKLKKS